MDSTLTPAARHHRKQERQRARYQRLKKPFTIPRERIVWALVEKAPPCNVHWVGMKRPMVIGSDWCTGGILSYRIGSKKFYKLMRLKLSYGN